MKNIDYNITLTCDRCGVTVKRTHMIPDYTPCGWREVSGRELRRKPPKFHFCPECSRELFGHLGLAFHKPEIDDKTPTWAGRDARDLLEDFSGSIKYDTVEFQDPNGVTNKIVVPGGDSSEPSCTVVFHGQPMVSNIGVKLKTPIIPGAENNGQPITSIPGFKFETPIIPGAENTTIADDDDSDLYDDEGRLKCGNSDICATWCDKYQCNPLCGAYDGTNRDDDDYDDEDDYIGLTD